MDKIYCGECKYIKESYHETEVECRSPENTKEVDTYRNRQTEYIMRPSRRNKDNNCGLFVSKCPSKQDETKKGLLSMFGIGKHDGALSKLEEGEK